MSESSEIASLTTIVIPLDIVSDNPLHNLLIPLTIHFILHASL